MRPERARWVSVAMAIAGLAAAAAAGPLKEGDPLPALGAARLEGAVPAMTGRVVLVDFWASWCGPCKKSFPELDKLHRLYADRGFLVLAVSVDEKEADMRSFLAAHPVAFPAVRDAKQALVAQVGVEAMPTSLLVDRKGVVRFVHKGFHGEETVKWLREKIEALLAEEAAP